MTREEAIYRLKNMAWLYGSAEREQNIEAIDMAIEALSANATVAKIQIDDIDKAKTSSQLLDDLAVDMVKAMGKRIVEVVRCKDCEHFELDHFDMVNGIPTITAHEICTRWCDGAKTDKDGFCFMAERREP